MVNELLNRLQEVESPFKPASPEERQRRIDSDPVLKKEAEDERLRREEVRRQNIERAKNPWKYDNTGVAVRGRDCGMCRQGIKKGERFLRIRYSDSRYGSKHKAICQNCVAKALQILRDND